MSAINGLTVGKQTLVVIQTEFNGQLNSARLNGSITELTFRSMAAMGTVLPINGDPINYSIPIQGEGNLTTIRTGDDLEKYWEAFTAAYDAGQNLVASSITVSGVNPDGTSWRYILKGVVFGNPDFGVYNGDAPVEQKLEFRYSRYESLL